MGGTAAAVTTPSFGLAPEPQPLVLLPFTPVQDGGAFPPTLNGWESLVFDLSKYGIQEFSILRILFQEGHIDATSVRTVS